MAVRLQWLRKELLGRLHTALAENLNAVQQAQPRQTLRLTTVLQVSCTRKPNAELLFHH